MKPLERLNNQRVLSNISSRIFYFKKIIVRRYIIYLYKNKS